MELTKEEIELLTKIRDTHTNDVLKLLTQLANNIIAKRPTTKIQLKVNES